MKKNAMSELISTVECPRCKSKNILKRLPYVRTNNIYIGIPYVPFINQKEYQCLDCGCEFEGEDI